MQEKQKKNVEKTRMHSMRVALLRTSSSGSRSYTDKKVPRQTWAGHWQREALWSEATQNFEFVRGFPREMLLKPNGLRELDCTMNARNLIKRRELGSLTRWKYRSSRNKSTSGIIQKNTVLHVTDLLCSTYNYTNILSLYFTYHD